MTIVKNLYNSKSYKANKLLAFQKKEIILNFFVFYFHKKKATNQEILREKKIIDVHNTKNIDINCIFILILHENLI